jgi:YVTN family beta-propeller protein
VTVIDGANDSVITTITVGNSPCALVYNPINNKVYCANYDSDDVTIIDGATDSVITTVTVGHRPSTLVYNPTNNKIYCANWSSGNVTVIDGAANSVIMTIGVGNEPTAFTYNPQQNRVYVANFSSSSISVIRDVTGIEEHTTLDAISFTPDIYPNPAKGMFRVRGSLTVKEIKIFDVSGKLVKVDEVTSAQSHKQEVRISLKGINPGIYFLKLDKETKKFLVVK